MCYYNGQKVTHSELIRLKNLEKAVLNYDFLAKDLQIGFDYSLNAVLKPVDGKEDFDIVQMEWGFIPDTIPNREAATRFRNGYKSSSGRWIDGYTTLNAKAENLFINEKGKQSIFADASKHRRCLVLSTGFFEWRHVFPPNKRTGLPTKTAVKYPHYISLKDSEYFYMAGIYQPWTDKETGEHINTFAITTTSANSLMQVIHNSKKRMPTILNEDLAYEWMFGNLSEDRITEIAKHQYPAEKMQACSIAKDFRESIEPSKPFSYEDLPALELNL